MNNTIMTKLFALPVAIASLVMAYACSTPERNEVKQVVPVQEQALDTTTTSVVPQTTTQPPLDLSGVDWTALGLFIEEERRIARQMEVDEARMRYGRCGEWYNLAMSIGWPAEEWPIISKVLYRESRCNIDSWNKTDPASGSRGLMQINGSWCRPNKWNLHPAGWLGAQGILTSCEDLFKPEVNLRAGLAIWLYGEQKHGCGWRGPWATPCG